jgi:hypothetical protein
MSLTWDWTTAINQSICLFATEETPESFIDHVSVDTHWENGIPET